MLVTIAQFVALHERLADALLMNQEERAAWIEHCPRRVQGKGRPRHRPSEILMPGKSGWREEAKRRRERIPIDDKVWRVVVFLAAERGVDAHQTIETISMGDM